MWCDGPAPAGVIGPRACPSRAHLVGKSRTPPTFDTGARMIAPLRWGLSVRRRARHARGRTDTRGRRELASERGVVRIAHEHGVANSRLIPLGDDVVMLPTHTVLPPRRIGN
jgi:hypothetical protein